MTVLCHKFGYNRSGAVIETFIGKYQIILYQIERIIGNINSTMYQNHLCVEQISCITWLLAEFFDEKSVFWTYIDCRKKSRNKLARKKSTRIISLNLGEITKLKKKNYSWLSIEKKMHCCIQNNANRLIGDSVQSLFKTQTFSASSTVDRVQIRMKQVK